MTDMLTTPLSPAQRHRHALALAGIMLAYLLATAPAGMLTNVCLGDEVMHFRFAQNIVSQGGLTCYDELFGSPFNRGARFEEPPLWQLGLVGLWRFVEGQPMWLAQLYQALWGVALVGATYYMARAVVNPAAALWAALLAASTPMLIVYGILLYMDLPYAAAGIVAFGLLFRRRYLLAGLMLAVSFGLKINGMFLAAPMVVVALLQDEGLRQSMRLRRRFGQFRRVLLAPAALVYNFFAAPGLLWRCARLFMLTVPVCLAYVAHRANQIHLIRSYIDSHPNALASTADFQSASGGLLTLANIINRLLFRPLMSPEVLPSSGGLLTLANIINRLLFRPLMSPEVLPSSMLSPTDIVTHAGPVLLFLVLWLAIGRVRGRGRPVDGRLLLSIGLIYFLVVFVVFSLNTDIRYAMPMFPMLAVLGGQAADRLTRARIDSAPGAHSASGGFVKWALVAVCLLQMAGTSAHVGRMRNKPPALIAAHEAIREHTEPGEFIVYPGQEMMIYAERPILWGRLALMQALFWPRSAGEAQLIFQYNGVRHIAIPHDSWYLYDDHGGAVAHYRGYPLSFVDALKTWDFVEPVPWLPPDAPLTVYRVTWSDLSAEELNERIRVIQNRRPTADAHAGEPPSDD